MTVIDIQHLFKTYPGPLFKPRVTALSDICIQVAEGEVFGFLGQNGAGKTTTLKIMMGLNRATSGTITLLGRTHTHHAVRARIGYLPEHPYFYDYLTAREFLTLYARLFDLKRFDPLPLLRQVGLEDDLHRRLRKFSKGMLQRVGIAQALINDPALLMFDEPMSGLDPMGRRLVRDLIMDLKARGKTVFFSSHIISDIETLCDRIAILHKGAIKAVGAINALIQPGGFQKQVVFTGLSDAGRQAFGARGWVPTAVIGGLAVSARSDQDVWHILDLVQKHDGRIVTLSDVKPSLEAFFMRTISETGGAP